MLVALALLTQGCTCNSRLSARAGDSPAVVVVDPEEASRPKPVAEEEPNNQRPQAQALVEGTAVEGALGGGSGKPDVDWYRLQVTSEQVLTVTLSGVPDADLSLEAFDDQERRLVRVNNSREGGGEVLVNLGVRSATYHFRVKAVKGKTGTGRYRIGYALRQREEGEEVEPNWKAALATALTLDEEATGYLGWQTDTDWYRVELKEVPDGARLRVEFDGLDHVRAGVSIHGPDGRVIQERWSQRSESVVLPNLAIPAPGGQVFVVVRCRQDVNVETRYSLRLLTEVPSGPTEVEPNDLPKQATVLEADGRTAIAGKLAEAADRDLYAIRVTKAQAVRVEVVPPLGVDVALAQVDGEGKTVWEVDEGKPREREILPAVWIQPPAGLVQVRAPRRDAVSAVTPYHIKALALGDGPWEREPNDGPQSATSWGGMQRSIQGFLHPDRDVDYYRMAPVKGLVVTAKPASGQQLKLELLLPQGGSVSSASSSAPGAEVKVEARGTRPLEYVLRVTGQSTASERGYTLTHEVIGEDP